MARFIADDGVEIAYHVWEGASELPPVVVHHGFTGSPGDDFVRPGIVTALVEAGWTVVGPDARGHGASGKPHDPSAYGEERMARDVSLLLDELAVPAVDLVGHSMGAVVALIAATREPRIRRVVVTGLGASAAELGGVDSRVLPLEALQEVLLAEDVATLADPGARLFRAKLDWRGLDRRALAAHLEAAHRSPIPLETITAPTLVLTGDADPFAARPEVLAAPIPASELRLVPGDHDTALSAPEFVTALVGFLAADL